MRLLVLSLLVLQCVPAAFSASDPDPGAGKGTPPAVTAITSPGPSSPEATSVGFQVVFNVAVSNVSIDDFTLTTTGTVNAVLDDVFEDTGPQTYLVIVSVNDGFGTIRLDLNGGTDIVGGSGGPPPAFSGGEVVRVFVASPLTFSFNETLTDTRQNIEMTELGDPPTYGLETIGGGQRSVREFPIGAGFELSPGDVFVAGEAYTLFMRLRLDDQTGYHKLVDFEEGMTDNGLYFFNGGLHFFPISMPASGSVAAGEWVDVAVTRSETGEVKTFLNGIEQETGMDSMNLARLSETPLRFFVDDTTTVTEESAGAIACVQFRDGALPPGEVAGLDCPFRVGLNDDGCSFDTLEEALATAGPSDRIHLTEQDEYLGRLALNNQQVYMEGSLLNEDCIIGLFGEITIPQLRNPLPVTGRGGVIELSNGANLSLVNVEVTDGRSGEGGAIYAGPGTRLSLIGAPVTESRALTSLTDAQTGTDGAAGGCVFADAATVFVSFSTLENCSVLDAAQAPGGDGGGLFVVNDATVTFQQGSLIGNTARSGGGMFARDSTIEVIENLRVEQNVAAESGGGGALQRSTLTVAPDPFNPFFSPAQPLAFFENNSARVGGGLAVFEAPATGEDLPIEFVRFSGNDAVDFGGGLFVADRSLTVADSSFIGNSANEGGAIRAQNAELTVVGSDACKSYLYLDPFMFFGLDRYCSRLESNDANFGSALSAILGSSVRLSRTAVVDNAASQSAIDLFDPPTSTLTMDNVWLGRNASSAIDANATSEIRASNVTIEGNSNAAVSLNDEAVAIINASIIFGNGMGITNSGTGFAGWAGLEDGCNIDQTNLVGIDIDPMLGTTPRGDAHLLPGSPAIDLCIGESTMPLRFTDLDAVPRIQGLREDAGAFESGPFLFGDGLE